jgi:hypothetical protein
VHVITLSASHSHRVMHLTHANPQAVNEHLAGKDADARSATSVVLDSPSLAIAPRRQAGPCLLAPPKRIATSHDTLHGGPPQRGLA